MRLDQQMRVQLVVGLLAQSWELFQLRCEFMERTAKTKVMILESKAAMLSADEAINSELVAKPAATNRIQPVVAKAPPS